MPATLIALQEDWDESETDDIVVLSELEDDDLIAIIKISLGVLNDRCSPYIETLLRREVGLEDEDV